MTESTTHRSWQGTMVGQMQDVGPWWRLAIAVLLIITINVVLGVLGFDMSPDPPLWPSDVPAPWSTGGG